MKLKCYHNILTLIINIINEHSFMLISYLTMVSISILQIMFESVDS